jgi:hypothetical protein
MQHSSNKLSSDKPAMKWFSKLSMKFAFFGGLWAAVIARCALAESGREGQLCCYILPILCGSGLAYIIGKMREMDD